MKLKKAAVLAAGLFATSCHDAGRENLLDPTLTPGVALAVTLNDTTGHAQLSWSPYDGPAPFDRHLVLRNEVESIRVDTLLDGADISINSFSDTTLQPNRAYAYRVSVVNSSGLEVASIESRTQGFTAEAIRLINLDPEHGPATMRMRWTRYRSPGFERYRILRRTLSNNHTEPLGEITEHTDTTFTDTSLLASVNYEWSVIVDTRFADTEFASLQSDWLAQSVLLTSVRLSDPVFDASTATATLTWRTYEGPRFRSYRVERSSPGLTPITVATFDDRTVDTYVDSGLVGGTRYDYEIVVVTQRDEEVAGLVRGGQFFTAVDEFPLSISDEGSVRLLLEDDGSLTALVAESHVLRLLRLTREGNMLDDSAILQVSPLSLRSIVPHSVSATRMRDGKLAVSVAVDSVSGVFFLDEDGQILREQAHVFADAFSEPLNALQQTVSGEAAITADALFSQQGTVSRHVAMDYFEVSRGQQLLFIDDFDTRDPGRWNNYQSFLDVEGGFGYFGAHGIASNTSVTLAKVVREEFLDFQVSLDLALITGRAGIRMGSDFPFSNSSFALVLDAKAMELQLRWRFLPESASDQEVRDELWTSPMFVLPGLPYRLSVAESDGFVTSRVDTPIVIGGRTGGAGGWGAVAQMGDLMIYSQGLQGRTVIDGDVAAVSELLGDVADMRTWSAGTNGVLVATVQPGRNLVATRLSSRFASSFQWPTEGSFSQQELGQGVGQEDGEWIFPLSIDRGPNDRFYVLDAGNARIQVFDEEGNYVTRWGTKGSASGEFDFGTGRVPEDFAGSIVVDDDGFVYVADPGNQRIQKFAP